MTQNEAIDMADLIARISSFPFDLALYTERDVANLTMALKDKGCAVFRSDSEPLSVTILAANLTRG